MCKVALATLQNYPIQGIDQIVWKESPTLSTSDIAIGTVSQMGRQVLFPQNIYVIENCERRLVSSLTVS